ncbi:MAG: AcrB/AcrD/AcrF family multidrug efflux protein [Cyanobacteria bacterium RYN_339]|nr:AcrB/AcrD/AcrF family multidrug efflux protein [Cyanobacteria bacterium RYN_339]
MDVVKLALHRPYTFVVAALLVILGGVVAVQRMATDIFPEINVPVVCVIWQYSGMAPEEMEKRIVTVSERAFTTTVNDIEHMESNSYPGISVIKIYFQPGAKVEAAVAQLTSISSTIVRIMPPGMTPPFIIRSSATNVPILQLGMGSRELSEQAIYDFGLNFVRTQLATVQGASVPLPYGGKARQIMIDLDPGALYAKGLAAADVTTAITAQNPILPAGTLKVAEREYAVRLNGSPDELQALEDLPIKQVNNTLVKIKDVGRVRDGYAVQANIVRQDGRRSALLTVMKSGGASTIDIVARVKAALPRIQATIPKNLEIKQMFDQSLFVRAAVDGVVREAVIATLLTAGLILLFLGSWRNALIVTLTIPLSILAAIMGLALAGQTMNIMTLGGLALAVGILVDLATVTIENIHRNHALGLPMREAIVVGARQIGGPALVSTLAICIVFVPIFALPGVAGFLFAPLAMAVVFAMIASYAVSRTLVPVLIELLIKGHETPSGFAAAFERGFERFRQGYLAALGWCLGARALVLATFVGFVAVSACLYPMLGRDFFPAVDAGTFRMHVRAPAGTRLEETEQVFGRVEAAIREIIPAREVDGILDNIGLPGGGFGLAFGDSATVGSSDGDVLVSLKAEHAPTDGYVRTLRHELPKRFPGLTFFFQPADIVGQILNFGLPAPLDVQVVGRNQLITYPLAREVEAALRKIPGAVDVHLHQIMDAPELRVNVDRDLATQVGLTQRDVANNMLISLSGSSVVAPSYWLNPKNGVNYLVAVQAPQSGMNSLPALQGLSVAANGRAPQLLGSIAKLEHRQGAAVVSHYNVQPTFDVYANVSGRDLGGVAADVERAIAPLRDKLPPGGQMALRGQVQSMNASFQGLYLGLLFAVVLVYALMVINFQSWLDPLIIMGALPGGLAGIAWILFATQTTLSVPALMGAIMCMGVATANAILVVSFANEQRWRGLNAAEAALEAGATRLRPVLMTALAMIVGMIPMALGLGEGAEQNAPLGRAVIGGLAVATAATLFVVPVLYAMLRKRPPRDLSTPFEATHTVPAVEEPVHA